MAVVVSLGNLIKWPRLKNGFTTSMSITVRFYNYLKFNEMKCHWVEGQLSRECISTNYNIRYFQAARGLMLKVLCQSYKYIYLKWRQWHTAQHITLKCKRISIENYQHSILHEVFTFLSNCVTNLTNNRMESNGSFSMFVFFMLSNKQLKIRTTNEIKEMK